MKANIPNIDSIRDLAAFWDHHELTEFEGDLVEVTEPVFAAENDLVIALEPMERTALKDLANKLGLDESTLLRQWVVERLRSA